MGSLRRCRPIPVPFPKHTRCVSTTSLRRTVRSSVGRGRPGHASRRQDRWATRAMTSPSASEHDAVRAASAVDLGRRHRPISRSARCTRSPNRDNRAERDRHDKSPLLRRRCLSLWGTTGRHTGRGRARIDAMAARRCRSIAMGRLTSLRRVESDPAVQVRYRGVAVLTASPRGVLRRDSLRAPPYECPGRRPAAISERGGVWDPSATPGYQAPGSRRPRPQRLAIGRTGDGKMWHTFYSEGRRVHAPLTQGQAHVGFPAAQVGSG
jgi:hypothetical protein